MNLYKKIFEHFSQKDSKTGDKDYFIAENDEEAYKIVFENDEDSKYFTHNVFNWENSQEYEDGDKRTLNELEKDLREEIIRERGDINLEVELADLYYGATLYGWELVFKDISQAEIGILERLNILK